MYTAHQKKVISRTVSRMLAGKVDPLAERAEAVNTIKAAAFTDSDGHRKVWVYVWSRDCDLCEGDSIRKVAATLPAVQSYMDEQYSYAEGPMTCRVITQSDAAEYRPHRRDRAAEMMGY